MWSLGEEVLAQSKKIIFIRASDESLFFCKTVKPCLFLEDRLLELVVIYLRLQGDMEMLLSTMIPVIFGNVDVTKTELTVNCRGCKRG